MKRKIFFDWPKRHLITCKIYVFLVYLHHTVCKINTEHFFPLFVRLKVCKKKKKTANSSNIVIYLKRLWVNYENKIHTHDARVIVVALTIKYTYTLESFLPVYYVIIILCVCVWAVFYDRTTFTVTILEKCVCYYYYYYIKRNISLLGRIFFLFFTQSRAIVIRCCAQ